MSLVAVRAESAPFVHPDLNDDARAVLAAIATDAREALTELRQVLVVLQRTSDEGERTPQPTACDVDDLVASAVAAGQPVDLDGEWRDVPPATGYVLYRAVQEGLTNARRHAPGVTARLSRTQTDGAVGFRMANPAERDAEPGRGLIGMRERVEALGGTMTAVVVDEEFVLEIQVPAVTRVVVADDQPVVLLGFAAILGAAPDLQVVGAANDGRELLALVARREARRRGGRRADAAPRRDRGHRADHRRAPGTRVLILTTFDLDEYVYDALRAGASGFLLKDVTADRLVEAVRMVADGLDAAGPDGHPAAGRGLHGAHAGAGAGRRASRT